MSTHIAAQAGEIAPTVLMPGDPLRAKFIAENFLEDAKLYNSVRNAFGYPGTYKGQPISVQASGMGIPSISIYANELMRDYDVQNLIRVGTAGGMSPDIHVRDIVIGMGASTDSGIIQTTFGAGLYYAPIANYELLSSAVETAKEKGLNYHVGNVLSADRFYNEEIDNVKLVDYGVMAVEMEMAALYMLAAKYNRRALGILSISDHLVTGEATTAQERETGLGQMIELALDSVVKTL